MQGRDPRDAWAFTQRICGVCTVVHAVASCRAVEDALDITIPPNANLIRNLVHGMQFVQDHVIHFYHLHALDWVDVVSAHQGRPGGHRGARAEDLTVAQQLRDLFPAGAGPDQEVRRQRAARDLHQRLLGTPGLQAAARGQPARGGALPRGARLAARRDPAAHRSSAARTRIRTSWSAAWRRPSTSTTRATINAARLTEIHDMITRAQLFVEQVYWPDLLAIAGFYKEWASIGGGVPELHDGGRVSRRRRPRHREALLPAWDRARSGPDQGLALRSDAGQGVHHQLVVRVLEGRCGGAASRTRARRRRNTPARRRPGPTCRIPRSTPG